MIKKKNVSGFICWMLLLTVITLGTVRRVNAEEQAHNQKVFNVLEFGATGNGKQLDTEAIQKTIDAAAKVGNGARVLIPGDHQYLIGTLVLKSGIDFHIQKQAELLVSTNREDYSGIAAIIANGADDFSISGQGTINGRAMEFMSHYEEENEWWIPKDWRSKLIVLTNCTNFEIRDINIKKAAHWTVHLLGCEDVIIENLNIDNHLDVPNCDGIDPDHCRNVEIRNCHITCGDDAIVVKTTRQEKDYGPSSNIWVHDCILETQDSGVKIGTETTRDIHNITFERCEIVTSCRGMGILLRDEGDVYNVTFKDIEFTSRYHSDPWWGRGEAISFTAIPRNPGSKIGNIYNIVVENVTGIAENSVRINGTKESRIRNVRFENVKVKMERWTKYPGNLMDNRPTKAYDAIEHRDNPGYYIRFSDQVSLVNCSIEWGDNIPEYFTHALEAHDVTALNLESFEGKAAHPDKYKAISIPKN